MSAHSYRSVVDDINKVSLNQHEHIKFEQPTILRLMVPSTGDRNQ